MGLILFAREGSGDTRSRLDSAPLYLFGGTKLGPVLFSVMVNDLVQSWGARIKFVDDLTVLEVVPRNSPSLLNVAVDDIHAFAVFPPPPSPPPPHFYCFPSSSTSSTSSSFLLFSLQVWSFTPFRPFRPDFGLLVFSRENNRNEEEEEEKQ